MNKIAFLLPVYESPREMPATARYIMLKRSQYFAQDLELTHVE